MNEKKIINHNKFCLFSIVIKFKTDISNIRNIIKHSVK